MRNLFLIALAVLCFSACKNSDKDKTASDDRGGQKSNVKSDYVITNDGINDLKIGMKQDEVEELLKQHLSFQTKKDAQGFWSDTVETKYKDLPLSLFFERFGEDSAMQVMGMETTSSLCKTTGGIGIGDDKSSILSQYDANPINMGPEWVPINDSTWSKSPTKYSISVSSMKDDNYNVIMFHLVNKKVVSMAVQEQEGD